MMVVNYTYCGDYFALHTSIKSFCCTPKTDTVGYINYISIKIFLEVTLLSDIHLKGSWYVDFLPSSMVIPI